jgi:hypothetical protein
MPAPCQTFKVEHGKLPHISVTYLYTSIQQNKMAATGCNANTNAPEFSKFSEVLTDSVCQCCAEMKSELLNVS